MSWPSKPQKQPETGDATIQYISGIKRNNLTNHYHKQSSKPTCGQEIELQKKKKNNTDESFTEKLI